MAQIICKNWENVWNGNQPWDREIAGNSIPEKAVLIDRPDDIIRASRLFPLGAVDFCNIAFFVRCSSSLLMRFGRVSPLKALSYTISQ